VSAKGRSVETRIVDALEAMAKTQAAVERTNLMHLELSHQVEERAAKHAAQIAATQAQSAKTQADHLALVRSAYSEAAQVQDEAIRRSIEMHETLMDRHRQLTEAHELWMASIGARAPDTILEDS
jgi:hypothetical protein